MSLFTHQKQNFDDNCGPTCVAIVANTTQFWAIRKMFYQDRTKWCYSWLPDICRGLTELGIEHGKRSRLAKKWNDIRKTSIVSVDDDWHWVVYSPKEGLVYDPARKIPVPVHKYRKKPCYYLTVTPRQ